MTEKTFFKNLLVNLVLFASPFRKKFEFDFEFDAKEFFDKKPDIKLREIKGHLIKCIELLIFVISYVISEISISLTFSKYKNGIMMEFYKMNF